MIRTFTTMLVGLLFVCFQSVGQNSITGRIMDGDTDEPLIGANIRLTETNQGTITAADGSFTLDNVADGTYKLLISYVGFKDQNINVTVNGGNQDIGTINLKESLFLSDQVVISGTRMAEKLTESPATIGVITSKQIDELPSFNPGELLARVKGVDFVRSGVVGTGVNIRGFNSNFNSKNLQVADGRLATLIATGLPLGPLNTQIKEDIERVEVILGPNSALYGPNAHNGLVHIISKDPRTSEGTTVAVNAGNQSMFSVRARHAQVVNEKFSFKLTAEHTQGEEFSFADSVYIDRDADGIKEDYEEFELDNDFAFNRVEGALYFSPNAESDIILSSGYSNSTYLAPTNVGRNQIKDWNIFFTHLRYTSENWFAQVYYTSSKTDSTYAIDERTKQYYRGIDSGMTPEEAGGAFSYGSGAIFQDDSKRINSEVQYHNTFGDVEIVTGVQYQQDMADSNDTYLLDDSDDLNVYQMGWYGQVQYKFADTWKAVAAFRADNHEIYDFNFVPKFGLVKTVGNGAWRLTYGQGIAAPTILNMYGDLFSGLILGNAQGFTLTDGTTVEKQKVEKIQTFEIGYKGQVVPNRLFVDANAYYNMSKDFLSPVTVVGVATERGDVPMDQVQSGYGIYGGLVATYINFGKVNTYGADFGFSYYFNDNLSADLNYSYFNYSVDENDMENDFNGDGEVNDLDILVNSPKNKMSLGLNYSSDKWFGTVFMRWVQAYNYYSSYQIASETKPGWTYRGTPIVEDARSTDTWNYGPLGGFVNVDIGLGYNITDYMTLSGQVTNLFDSEIREFTASPFIGRLYSAELKFKF
ncbi:MAG: TonB-dependent receptor [Reichenbachiella sp.]|uniref:TonB-dependent receptor n=3 Tax=Reichenbachiella sp. TaxID=2184521 RepID=UPI00329945E1